MHVDLMLLLLLPLLLLLLLPPPPPLLLLLQERDPVERVRKLLIAKGYDASAIKAIEKSVKKEVDTAVEESKVSGVCMRRGTMPYVVCALMRRVAACVSCTSGAAGDTACLQSPVVVLGSVRLLLLLVLGIARACQLLKSFDAHQGFCCSPTKLA
jgi:hypothetical protein